MSRHIVKFPGVVDVSPRKITGRARTVRLRQLAKDVYSNHRRATLTHKRWLDRVHDAGKALLEAKRLLGGRGKWGRWMRSCCADATKDGYKFSCRTARAYMQVARKWDDPLVTEERERGSITSINALLRVVQKPWTAESVKNAAQQEKLIKMTEADKLRFELRKMFNQDLKGNYTLDELDVLYSDFYSIADVYREEVRSRLREREALRSKAHGYDYHDFEPQEPEMTRNKEKKYVREHERDRRRMVEKIWDYKREPAKPKRKRKCK